VLGKFITFEGGEGGGKTTQSKLLCEALQKAGYTPCHTREPGGTEGGEAIRALLVKGDTARWDAVTETLLHFAARRDHVMKVVRPQLEAGNDVICDRFIHSTYAYQAFGHGLGVEYIRNLHNLTIGRVYPCLTFIMDIDPAQGIGRTEKRLGDENRYERMDRSYHETVRQGFLTMAAREPERCVVLDATKPVEVLHKDVLEVVNARFGREIGFGR
jgi:dTMP kinase